MKSIKILTICALSVLFFACSKDDDGGDGGSAASGTMTGKVDGTTVTSTSQLTTGTKVANGTGSYAVVLQGTNMEGKGYQISLSGVDGEGTYEIGGSSLVYNIGTYVEGNATDPLNSQTWTAPYDDDSLRGEVQISTFTDEKVIGTFNFTCKNPNDDSVKTITDGSFNVNLN